MGTRSKGPLKTHDNGCVVGGDWRILYAVNEGYYWGLLGKGSLNMDLLFVWFVWLLLRPKECCCGLLVLYRDQMKVGVVVIFCQVWWKEPEARVGTKGTGKGEQITLEENDNINKTGVAATMRCVITQVGVLAAADIKNYYSKFKIIKLYKMGPRW